MDLPSLATNGVHYTANSTTALMKALGMGLKLTSSTRSPEHNAAVGGSKTSFHVAGTAYDFGGTPANMQKFADWAKGTGFFTEVIYGTADHKDHVHIGWGKKSSPTIKVPESGSASPEVTTPTDDKTFVSNMIQTISRTVLLLLIAVFAVVLFMQAFPVQDIAMKAVTNLTPAGKILKKVGKKK